MIPGSEQLGHLARFATKSLGVKIVTKDSTVNRKARALDEVRLVERLSRAPWQAKSVFDPKKTLEMRTRATNHREYNAALAADLLKGKIPIFYVDELAQDIVLECTGSASKMSRELCENPQPVPPYDDLWIEYFWRTEKPTSTGKSRYNFGAYIASGKMADNADSMAKFTTATKGARIVNEDPVPDRYVMLMIYTDGSDGAVLGPLTTDEYYLNAGGDILLNDEDITTSDGIDKTYRVPVLNRINLMSENPSGSIVEDMVGDALIKTLATAIRTFSLLGCRNVRQVDGEPERRVMGVGPTPGLRHKVLRVEIGGKLRPIYERGPATGIEHALHRVRGHFSYYGIADPRDGRMREGLLFGKHRCKMWVPSHLRGNAERGVVDKDYEVGRAILPEPPICGVANPPEPTP